VQKFTYVIDLAEASLGRHLSTLAREFFSKLVNTDSRNYPEALGHIYIINTSRIFPVIWSFVKNMVRAPPLPTASLGPRGVGSHQSRSIRITKRTLSDSAPIPTLPLALLLSPHPLSPTISSPQVDPKTRERVEVLATGKSTDKGGWARRLRAVLGPAMVSKWADVLDKHVEQLSLPEDGRLPTENPSWATLAYKGPAKAGKLKAKKPAAVTSRRFVYSDDDPSERVALLDVDR